MVFDDEAPELPAIVYVSEVSHMDGDDAYVFGAGLYIDKVLGAYGLRAFCGRDERIVDRIFPAEMAPDGAIHYYAVLHLPPTPRRAGRRHGRVLLPAAGLRDPGPDAGPLQEPGRHGTPWRRV